METSTTTSTTRTVALIGDTTEAVDRLAKKCRALTLAAEWLDEHGVDLPFHPYITAHVHRDYAELAFQVCNQIEGDEQQKAATALIVRVVGGYWTKTEGSGVLYLDQRDNELLHFSITVDRAAVCERVVTGTREVTVPAVEATPERVEVVDNVEWVCAPILTGGAA